ncbi:MAG: family 10 glycosylhydrolase [Verrucomicrobiae bacterium]|nr:family 10 glycosylhydrolase [Verrucomicrobiae bacterium]
MPPSHLEIFRPPRNGETYDARVRFGGASCVVLLGFALVFAALLASCETTLPSTAVSESRVTPPAGEFRGAWVYDPRRFEPEDVVRNLKQAGFTAVFVRLSSAGAAYYPSAILPRAPGTTRDYAAEYAEAGRRYGLQVHAWHVCFMMHYAPPAAVTKAIKTGMVMRDAKGRALRPTYNVPVRTPAVSANRSLETHAMLELVTRYPIDGVQLDYIRYFSGSVDYSASSRAAFEASLGKKVKNWPRDVVSGALCERYHAWKAGLITKVVADTSTAIRAAVPHAKISAAVWHSADVGYNDYAQDWPRWVKNGYLDFVVPMNYTRNDRQLAAWIEAQREGVNGKIPLYAGIGAYQLDSPRQLNRQINIVRAQGLSGYVLYSYDEAVKSRFFEEIVN